MKRLLLVEDDAFLVRVYRTKLKQLGYEVEIMTDGKEVFAWCKKNMPELVVLDVVMPEKDGFTVLKELKESEDTRKIPVLVLTNLKGDDDKESLVGLGAEKVLVKSESSFSDVVTRIREIAG